MRVLTYTNPNGISIELGTTAYPITSLSGLGISGLDQQTQKAPFQDGSTFIASYLTDREIVVQGAINKPKNLIALNSGKDRLLRALNPTIGQGKLTYTYDGGSKEITCTPNITFSNKDGKDPFLRWQISFTCNDPFFKKVSLSTDSLSKIEIPQFLVGQTFGYMSIAKISDTSFLVFYKDTTTENLYCIKTINTGSTWSAPVLVAATNYSTRFAQGLYAAGKVIVIYNTTTDGNGRGQIKQKTSTDLGATWGAEETFSALDCYPLGRNALVVDDNGVIYGYFSLYLSGYMSVGRNVSIDGGVSWAFETVAINVANAYPYRWVTPVITHDNTHLIMYLVVDTSISINTIYQKNLSSTVISAPFGVGGQYTDGFFFFIKRKNSILFVNKLSTTQSRLSENFNSGLSYDSYFDSVMFECGIPIFESGKDSFLMSRKTSFYIGIFSTVLETIYNGGHAKTGVTITINGPALNPKIENVTTGEYVRVLTQLAAGEQIIINTGFNNKSVSIIKAGVTTSAMGLLDNGSTFFELGLLNNILYYSDLLAASPPTITWKERHLGV
jgi:hypothetical protein